ncbi:MAG TPA: HEAT repeat domain-containing protein, partial [Phycisphaerae bacterium]|nr:HEAT repeat domain-containing protein [Phycisphaerae bacterium]
MARFHRVSRWLVLPVVLLVGTTPIASAADPATREAPGSQPAEAVDPAHPDTSALVAVKVAPTAEGIGAYLRELKQQNASSEAVERLIRELGADQFQQRERATRQLIEMPMFPEAAVRRALKDSDIEVRSRAAYILKQAASGSSDATLCAALRTIRRLEIKGLAAEVLDILPLFDSAYVQALGQDALRVTARPEDAALLRETLKSVSPAMRSAGALALASALGEKAADDLRGLLKDPSGDVVFASARALADQGDRASLPALVRLLDSNDAPIRSRSIAVLRALTGQKFEYQPYAEPAERAKGRKHWEQWVTDAGQTAKLAFPIKVAGPLGRTLLCVPGRGVIIEYDAEGKERWKGKINSAWACQGLPDGHRLAGSYSDKKVVEFDDEGKEVWKVENLPGGPMSVQRLENGNTLVACSDAQQVIEYKPDVGIAWKLDIQGRPADARRLLNGNTLIALHHGSRVVEINAKGEEVWSYNVRDPQTVQRLENGNTVIWQATPGAVIEVTPKGETVWKQEGLGGIL